MVLEASAIDAIDYTAAAGLSAAIRACREKGVDFAVARLESVRAQTAFAKYGVFDALGGEERGRQVAIVPQRRRGDARTGAPARP